jgi:hypothetical protein
VNQITYVSAKGCGRKVTEYTIVDGGLVIG